MSQSWLLTDVDQRVFVPELERGPADFTGELVRGLRVKKYVLRGGLGDGVDVIEVENGAVRLVLLPTRGMGIHKVFCGDVELGWQSPVRGPVHPTFVNLFEGSGIGWLAGFDEWLCRCGLESNGGPEWNEAGRLVHPLHGRIANTPAHRVEISVDGQTGEISVSGIVDESRLFGRKLRLTSTVRLRGGEPSFSIHDEVTNLSSEPTDFELLYHINFGLPFLQPGATLVAPAVNVVPQTSHSATDVARWNTYGPGEAGLGEFVHFFTLAADAEGRTNVLLKAADDRAAALHFNTRQLPCFTQWKLQQPGSDGYVTGLEPGTNYPNVRSFEEQQGRVPTLQPGASQSFDLAFDVLTTQEAVAAHAAAIEKLAGGKPPRVFERPQPGWSPA
ncbi:MAG TPA: aldose 1-epimerase family protein [Pirellulales bacterium]|nr:aldose 1-epimerase family protein [Pirellulales bacterium]